MASSPSIFYKGGLMKKRFKTEQIIKILEEAEAGVKVKDIIRQHGITEQTFYRWKSKYGGLDVSDAARLKELDSENKKLKRLVADKELQILGLKEALSKKY
jgi:putative transposase